MNTIYKCKHCKNYYCRCYIEFSDLTNEDYICNKHKHLFFQCYNCNIILQEKEDDPYPCFSCNNIYCFNCMKSENEHFMINFDDGFICYSCK